MKKGIAIITMILVGLVLMACDEVARTAQTTAIMTTNTTTIETTTIVVPLVMEFDFDIMEDTETESLLLDDLVIISGNNITTADYDVDFENDILTFKKEYLAYLAPGLYTYTLHRAEGEEQFKLNVIDRNQHYRLINESFETGDLFGWGSRTIFKGERNLLAFTDSVVVPNGLIPGTEAGYGGDGDYLVGIEGTITESLFEEKLGELRSSTFTLGGSGFITFRLAGGGNPALGYLSVRSSDSDVEVARFYPEQATLNPAELVLYKADLHELLGYSLYLELVDLGGHEGDYLVFDDFRMYHEIEPAEGITATNILPVFPISYVPNQLPNGDFHSGLTGWTEVYGEAFLVQDNTLKSNNGGDQAKGAIRSQMFRVDGSGIATIRLAAAEGARYDKDTFVSVREQATNREILRFANRNHDGITPVTYYLDLRDYLGKNLYFEIVDNASSSYDTIFVSEIVTYYPELPVFTYQDLAINLNE